MKRPFGLAQKPRRAARPGMTGRSAEAAAASPLSLGPKSDGKRRRREGWSGYLRFCSLARGPRAVVAVRLVPGKCYTMLCGCYRLLRGRTAGTGTRFVPLVNRSGADSMGRGYSIPCPMLTRSRSAG